MHSVFRGATPLVICGLISALSCSAMIRAAFPCVSNGLGDYCATSERDFSWLLEKTCSGHDTGTTWHRDTAPGNVESASKFYGDALPLRLHPVYEAMRLGAFAGEDATVLPESISKDEAKQCWQALKMDCPELMFSRPPLMVLRGDGDYCVTGISWDNRLAPGVFDEANETVSRRCMELVGECETCWGIWEKAECISYAIAATVEYDEDAPYSDLAYGASLGRAHCKGQSELAVIAMREAGLNAVLVMGMATANGTPECHDWVAVYSDDGRCRFYDPTWVGTMGGGLFTDGSQWLGMSSDEARLTHCSFHRQLFE